MMQCPEGGISGLISSTRWGICAHPGMMTGLCLQQATPKVQLYKTVHMTHASQGMLRMTWSVT